MSDLFLVWRNLMRRKLRTFLMLFAILIAFLIFGVLGAFQYSFDNAGSSKAGENRLVVVNKINFTQPLPISYVARVRAMEGVRSVAHLNWFGGYYQDPKNFMVVMAVDPASYLDVYSDYEVSDAARHQFTTERTSALVGEALAKKYGWKEGDHVPLSSNIYTQKNGSKSWDFTIAGILKPKIPTADSNFFVFTYAYFDETRAFGKDQIGWMTLTTASPDLNDKISKQIDQTFANSPYETSTDTEKAFNKAFMAQLGNIALIVMLVVGAAFVTILMIVGNTMAMAVRERTREIGVLKTLGFPGGRILRMVLGESLLLALLGGLLGLGLATLLAFGMRDQIGGFLPNFTMSASVIGIGFALIALLGIVTGLLPALNAMRMPIVSALGRD